MKAHKQTIRHYYKYSYSAWTQPILTSNGELGSDTFAVASNGDYSTSYPAWKAFDGTNTGWWANASNNPGYIILYNPNPLNIKNISIQNYNGSGAYAGYFYSKAGEVYGSDNGETWTLLTNYTNTVSAYNSWWDISLSSNTTYYKYYKITTTSFVAYGTEGWNIQEMTVTATQRIAVESTPSDYDFYKDVNTYRMITARKYYKKRTFTQNSTFVVPNNITSLKVDCVASKGADTQSDYYHIDVGGNGGRVQCDLSVTPGETLYFTVGAIMSPGGTASYNASDIRKNTNTIANRVIVAGGGGNAGNFNASYNGAGGAGGGLIGGDGETSLVVGGTGGTQTAGGTSSDPNAQPGTQEMGASGGDAAGGAGYWGGGCGRRYSYSVWYVSGGGGGSSYTDPSLCSYVVHTQGYNNGSGYIIIAYESTSSDYDYYEDVYKVFNV